MSDLNLDEVRLLAEHALRHKADLTFAEMVAADRVIKVLGRRQCNKRLRLFGNTRCALGPDHDGPHVPDVPEEAWQ